MSKDLLSPENLELFCDAFEAINQHPGKSYRQIAEEHLHRSSASTISRLVLALHEHYEEIFIDVVGGKPPTGVTDVGREFYKAARQYLNHHYRIKHWKHESPQITIAVTNFIQTYLLPTCIGQFLRLSRAQGNTPQMEFPEDNVPRLTELVRDGLVDFAMGPYQVEQEAFEEQVEFLPLHEPIPCALVCRKDHPLAEKIDNQLIFDLEFLSEHTVITLPKIVQPTVAESLPKAKGMGRRIEVNTFGIVLAHIEEGEAVGAIPGGFSTIAQMSRGSGVACGRIHQSAMPGLSAALYLPKHREISESAKLLRNVIVEMVPRIVEEKSGIKLGTHTPD